MTNVLLVVFDGLRPDRIRPDVTPNLARFAALGARMPHARSVFPSETRVCTASVATGCHPRKHGLVANRMLHPGDRLRIIETGSADQLRALEHTTGEAAILMPGLSDLIDDFAVFSSGTPGQTFILAPAADTSGQIVVSAHGPKASSRAGQAILARLDPPPAAPADRAVWIADAWRTTMLPNPPAASVLWLCEPDTSAHYAGLDSVGQRQALTAADAAFGRILDDWQRGPYHDHLQIIVASDHGHVTGDHVFDLRAALEAEPEFTGCSLTGGPSGGIGVPGGERDRIAAVAAMLMRRDWIANVFVADAIDLPHGALPHSAVLLDHRRTANILYTLRNTTAPDRNGLVGTSWLDTEGSLAIGAGTHGGLNPREMATVLLLAGSAIKPAALSNWPAGLIDIAPTILALLNRPGATSMDGRVLTEILLDGADPTDSRGPETWEAANDHYAQRVARMRVGRHVWIDHAAREAVASAAPIAT